jgi:hypothetical protein
MERKVDDLTLLELAKKVVVEAEANAKENPTSESIQVVVVEPNKKPYKKTIKNDLESMQAIVGGYIENVFIGRSKKGARVGITLNEEGKLEGLPMNRMIVNYDILVGTFFITAYNLQGDNISLTNEEADYYIKCFNPIEVYL